jgi:hypothetical protein
MQYCFVPIRVALQNTQYLRLLAVCAAALGFMSASANAQTQLDISSCFNSLLQQQVDYTSDIRLALATLSQISESTYEASKHDVSLAGQYKFLAASINYADFLEKRREYFQLNKLDLQYFQSISLKTRTLDSRAYGVIKDCVDKVAADQYGFHYLYTVDDANTASVQLFWRPTEGGRPLEITDSVLLNAKAKTQGVPDGKLFPYVSHWSLTPYPKILGASNAILLERTDVNKNINCTIATRPQVKTFDIVIPFVAKPSKDLVCNTVYDTKDPVTGKDYFGQEALVLNVTDGHGCPDCHGYFLAIDAPGPVIDVTCRSSGDHVWQEICDSNGSHIRAIGYENANPRSLYISYHYKVARQDCKFPDIDKQKMLTQGLGSVMKTSKE